MKKIIFIISFIAAVAIAQLAAQEKVTLHITVTRVIPAPEIQLVNFPDQEWEEMKEILETSGFLKTSLQKKDFEIKRFTDQGGWGDNEDLVVWNDKNRRFVLELLHSSDTSNTTLYTKNFQFYKMEVESIDGKTIPMGKLYFAIKAIIAYPKDKEQYEECQKILSMLGITTKLRKGLCRGSYCKKN